MASSTRSRSAADILTPVWRSQVADLRFWETEVRLRRPESVHRFRVATRRLRSNLSAFESLLDAAACRTLERDLERTSAAVAGVRDAEIVRERIERMAGGGAIPGVASTLVLLGQALDRSDVTAWEKALGHLDGPEYDAVTRGLDAFADLPPWLPTARSSAGETLAAALQREWSRFRRRARSALDPVAPASLVHDTRKAAKRTRYVAETLRPALGKKAKRIERSAQRVQAVLGEYQDCIIVQEFLDGIHLQQSLGADQWQVLRGMRELEAEAAAARRREFARVFVEIDRPSRDGSDAGSSIGRQP
jgi:CHAD domain-containing protein